MCVSCIVQYVALTQNVGTTPYSPSNATCEHKKGFPCLPTFFSPFSPLTSSSFPGMERSEKQVGKLMPLHAFFRGRRRKGEKNLLLRNGMGMEGEKNATVSLSHDAVLNANTDKVYT